MTKILFFDKGGRKERIELIKKNKAPRDFFQGIDTLVSKGYDIQHICSSKKYKKNLFFLFGNLIEKFFCKLSNVGIRPFSVFQNTDAINSADYVVSLTDGFSISLGFYYYFIDKKSKIKLAGAFHKLSDFDSRLPKYLKKIYYKLFLRILKRLDYIIFYGEADRTNSIKHFNINEKKTLILKFGVDTQFWRPKNKKSFNSNFLFSIGQDPARDFETLLKVKSNKKVHIHTSLLAPKNKNDFKITNGTYHKFKSSFSDLKIRKLYQDSFAVIVPLKNVFQPSGYSVTLQAMACGKPVILTLTKGLWAPTIFINKKNCILVSPGMEKEIEDAINYLQNNRLNYTKISKNARETALQVFSLEQANYSTMELINKFV